MMSSSLPREEADSGDRDHELLQRARRGDFAAFEAILDRHQHRIFGLARRITGNHQDAEDVTQQTFVSVLEHLEDYRADGAIAGWILRIAANHSLKVLRKKRGLPTVPLEAAADPEDSYARLPHPHYIAPWRESPEDLADRAEVRALIEQALEELDEKYRLVFILRDMEEMSVRDTAAMLGLSEANVKVRLLRARLQLRERLTPVLGDEAARVFPDHSHEAESPPT